MADEHDQEEGDAAAEAFEELRAEVTLLRRAVERLAAERAEVPQPKDYDETLGRIAKAINKLAERMDVLAERPGISITPDGIARQVAAAGATVRAEDAKTIAEARAALEKATTRLDGIATSARSRADQMRWLRYSSIGGVVAGAVLWAVAGGAILRATPDAWAWPESAAMQTLGTDAWGGARRLAVSRDRETWDAMVAGVVVGRGNQDALQRCQTQADQAGEPVRCTVRIRPQERP